MAYELTDLLVALADAQTLKEFSADPETFMTNARLSEQQKRAVRDGDQYRIRRFCAREMLRDSLHAQLLTRIYDEHDPDFKLFDGQDPAIALPEHDVDHDVDHNVDHDVDHNIDHEIVQTHDLGDDIAEFSPKYNVAHYYDHLFSDSWISTKKNELVFIGTGIDGANHLTAEAISHIANADKVLYCVADLVIERRLHILNSCTEDLYVFYGDNKPRRQTYEEMVQRILESLKEHRRVCAVFYGHPGIFVWPSYRAIQIARKDGYRAYMLPAVSSLDCLFADVGFDPSRHSCQIVEATDLLVRLRRPDVSASVIIFQVGCVGDLGYNSRGYDRRNVPILAEYLASYYGLDYEVILYEAAQYPVCKPKIRRISIAGLVDAKPSGITTLYIPPKILPGADGEMLGRLGLKRPVKIDNQNSQ
jgi:precorrin-6B methylase 1